MKSKLCSILLIAFIADSCVHEYEFQERCEKDIGSCHLTTDEALSSLELFNGCLTNYKVNEREIDVIDTIRVHKQALLYVVNYKDNGGYSVLSADKRIPYKVLADVEKGRLTADAFVDAAQMEYEESFGDAETKLIAACLYNYARRSIELQDFEIDDSVDSLVRYRYEDPVHPLLHFAVDWSQEDPFNAMCPTVTSSLGTTVHGYAGCVPLAVSKIMTYQESPRYLFLNGVRVDWAGLKVDYSAASTSAALLLAFIGNSSRSIYSSGGTFTFPSNAAAFMRDYSFSDAEFVNYDWPIMKSRLDAQFPVILSAIPLVGNDTYVLSDSHAWNVDGYKVMIKEAAHYMNERGHHVVFWQEYDRKYYVHCDFGWRGVSNGYYAEGVFDLAGNDVLLDGYGSNTDYNYNFYLKMITYSVVDN